MDSVYAMPPAKLNFPGPIGTKRRRMRSGGGVSTLTNNTPKVMESHPEEPDMADPPPQEKKGKCKLATTIPIFLKSKCIGSATSTGVHLEESQRKVESRIAPNDSSVVVDSKATTPLLSHAWSVFLICHFSRRDVQDDRHLRCFHRLMVRALRVSRPH